MNYLHMPFRKSGKILDSDMLYTLSLFALEPARWVEKYEWRKLTELELCACGTFWKSMGDAMKIPYLDLPSCATGWQDGLHWLDEIREWSLRYEENQMVPADTNKKLANSHLDVIFVNLPYGVVEIGKKCVTVLLGERLRKAFMYVPKPSVSSPGTEYTQGFAQVSRTASPILQDYFLGLSYSYASHPLFSPSKARVHEKTIHTPCPRQNYRSL